MTTTEPPTPTYYKILRRDADGTLVSCHGGTHRWEPRVLYGPVPVRPCRSGFHACRVGDLTSWLTPGMIVYEVMLLDVIVEDNKVVGSSAALGACRGTLETLDFVRIAIYAARLVAHLNTDPRVMAAIDA